MSTTTEAIRNGVNAEQLFGTLDAINADPSLARFQFRARNRWIDGAHNRSTIRDLYAANQEDTSRAAEFVLDAREPAILLGTDTGPNPAEYLLQPLRYSSERPSAPRTSMSPSSVDSTSVR